MRILCMHKANQHSESATAPCDKVAEGLGPLIADMMQAGVFVSAEGLRPSKFGMRLRFSNGERAVIPGPLKGEQELIASLCIVSVAQQEEAIEWASRWASILGDVEIDARPIAEPWDMGFCPPPSPDPPLRYMLIRKADERTERGELPTTAQRAALQQWKSDMEQAGALLLIEDLLPSTHAARMQLKGQERKIVDGPFTESKEMIAGYCLMNVPSRAQAVDWSWRFAEIMGDLELDIRPLAEPTTAAA